MEYHPGPDFKKFFEKNISLSIENQKLAVETEEKIGFKLPEKLKLLLGCKGSGIVTSGCCVVPGIQVGGNINGVDFFDLKKLPSTVDGSRNWGVRKSTIVFCGDGHVYFGLEFSGGKGPENSPVVFLNNFSHTETTVADSFDKFLEIIVGAEAAEKMEWEMLEERRTGKKRKLDEEEFNEDKEEDDPENPEKKRKLDD